MSVFDNVAYGLKIRKYRESKIKERVKKALDLVGLSGKDNRYPTQLSGGEQQRVSIARSLVYEPETLLLDEPLSNLDLRVREKMRSEIRELLKRIGITAIYVTHDQEEAFSISDRVIIINNGKVMQEGTPNEIYEKPANKFVAEFIGRSNILRAEIKEIYDNNVYILKVPDMNADLICKTNDKLELKKTNIHILIRNNEIGIYDKNPENKENILQGQIIHREYRGSVTDHKIRVGETFINVTTHKYCGLYHSREEIKYIFIYIPPEAIRILNE
jgi:ABC-type Fe3+/spermidine/putrescine transport system ATPase subunit